MNELLTTYLPTIFILAIVYATNFFKPFFFEAVVTVNLTSQLGKGLSIEKSEPSYPWVWTEIGSFFLLLWLFLFIKVYLHLCQLAVCLLQVGHKKVFISLFMHLPHIWYLIHRKAKQFPLFCKLYIGVSTSVNLWALLKGRRVLLDIQSGGFIIILINPYFSFDDIIYQCF